MNIKISSRTGTRVTCFLRFQNMEASLELFEVNAVGHFEKITTDDLKSLISFYQKNPVLWNLSHPQYRNHALKNKAKEELVKALGSKY